MNRREFISVIGGATVASRAIQTAGASERTTDLFLNGLLLISFEEEGLRIGFAKAPGHKGILRIVPLDGPAQTVAIKGNLRFDSGKGLHGRPNVFAPEAVQMSEIYGSGVKANFDRCPTIIDIPYTAIKSITSNDLTRDRWTFVRADNKQEIDSFRPRRIAEGLKLELLSNGVLKLDGEKTVVQLSSTQEVVCNYAPEPKDVYPDMYIDHFAHYMQHLQLPPAADFRVEPKKITGANQTPTPRVGNHWIPGTIFCFVVIVGPLSS